MLQTSNIERQCMNETIESNLSFSEAVCETPWPQTIASWGLAGGSSFTQLVMGSSLFKPLSACAWTDRADRAGHLSIAWKLGRSAQRIAVAISCKNILSFWNLTHCPIPASILSRNLKRKGKAESLLSLSFACYTW